MIIRYVNNLNVTPILGSGDKWLLTSDFQFKIDKHPITINKGFETDFASIPNLLRSILGSPASGKWRYASVVHDFLYNQHAYARKTCDEIFLQLMKQDGVSTWKAYTMYYAVRAFGGSHYAG